MISRFSCLTSTWAVNKHSVYFQENQNVTCKIHSVCFYENWNQVKEPNFQIHSLLIRDRLSCHMLLWKIQLSISALEGHCFHNIFVFVFTWKHNRVWIISWFKNIDTDTLMLLGFPTEQAVVSCTLFLMWFTYLWKYSFRLEYYVNKVLLWDYHCF